MLRFIRWTFAVWSRRETRRLHRARCCQLQAIHDWDGLGRPRLRTQEHGIRTIHSSSPTLIPGSMAVEEAVEVVTVEEAAAVEAEATARLGAQPPEDRVALAAMALE